MAIQVPVETRAGWRMPLLGVALLVGIVGRVSYSWAAPFWFDETFSGVIATQPSFARLLDWCLTELTGPAYYMPLWLWAKVAGSGDLALRLPSLALAVAVPLLILWKGDEDRDQRLLWGVFCLLWAPLFSVAGEARAYPQLFALGVAQAILFVRLLERPTTGRASAWMATSVLLILTNYWGAVPGLVQGLAYLAFHRGRAVRTWPAVLLLMPLVAWAYWHLPMVLAFTGGDVFGGWPLSAVTEIPATLFGVTTGGTVILGTVVVTSGLYWRRPVRFSPSFVLALCGLASVALILLLAFVKPGFALRYVTPAIPSFLFALALWARWMLARSPRAVVVVLAVMIVTSIGVSVSAFTTRDPRHLFNLEQPSAWLAERPPARLVLLWDGPVGARTPGAHLDEVGGFFLRRAGHPVTVAVVRATAAQDPNREVIALLGNTPDAALLWFANDDLSAGRKPALESYDNSLECRDFGGGMVTMTACRRRR